MKEMSNPFCFGIACVHWPDVAEMKMQTCGVFLCLTKSKLHRPVLCKTLTRNN